LYTFKKEFSPRKGLVIILLHSENYFACLFLTKSQGFSPSIQGVRNMYIIVGVAYETQKLSDIYLKAIFKNN